jgi:acetolactate synthase-1/2/3 large subunit
MGYGLSGAIGVAFAEPNKNVILLEGDGGFLQNMQELGTAKVNNLNLKIIIYNDNGYSSIRMTQKNYFGGDYIGCDSNTGLGMPDFRKLAESYDIKFYELTPKIFKNKKKLSKILNKNELSIILIPIDPEQTYFPKITSRVLKNGNMESNPLNLMSPVFDDERSLELMRNPDE